jgi:hypothetical protein
MSYLIVHVVTMKSDKNENGEVKKIKKEKTLSTVHDIVLARHIIHL